MHTNDIFSYHCDLQSWLRKLFLSFELHTADTWYNDGFTFRDHITLSNYGK